MAAASRGKKRGLSKVETVLRKLHVALLLRACMDWPIRWTQIVYRKMLKRTTAVTYIYQQIYIAKRQNDTAAKICVNMEMLLS